LRFKPEWVAQKIAPLPVLMIYAEHDMLVSVQEQLDSYEASGDSKKPVKRPKAQHYELYGLCNP